MLNERVDVDGVLETCGAVPERCGGLPTSHREEGPTTTAERREEKKKKKQPPTTKGLTIILLLLEKQPHNSRPIYI